MGFLEAVVLIDKREDLFLCDDPTELSGMRSCICVYQTFNGADGFVGKLRWPNNGEPAFVDETLIWALQNPSEDARLT